ncbi:MAG: hypothetical protein IKM99_09995 [Bacteroidales bacterium]|nr:hypothetical protein [Bacteroidales bacterium]
MKRIPRKIWIWILSGMALLFGSSCQFFQVHPPCVYGPPKVYGPPPPMESDTIPTSNPDSITPDSL